MPTPEHVPDQATGSPPDAPRAVRVLVVDDDTAICRMVATILAFEGFEVLSANDGVAALATLRQWRPDVVILDLMMPAMDGLSLAQRLRDDDATASIPIIVLTARSSESEVWEGWQAGVDSYLTKPFEVEALLAEVFRVVAHSGAAA